MLKFRSVAPVAAALAIACTAYWSWSIRPVDENRAPANAQAEVSILPDYDNYEISEVTPAQASALFASLNRDFRSNSICANRAHVWAYDMLRNNGIKSGKAFIHFTPSGLADEDITWAYHVAPYIIVNDNGVKTEMVLDAGFGSIRGPITMSQWSKYFGKSANCVVLDPQNNPEHLRLEDRSSPGLHPNNRRVNGAMQYPTPAGSTCYLRKTPMHYWMPYIVYGNDLYRSGRSEYSIYQTRDFNSAQLVQACKNGLSSNGLIFNKRKYCREYLGFE